MATLYVGSSQTYETIADAVKAANSGDTIIVYGSEYTATDERVRVDKSLTLRAEGDVTLRGMNIGGDNFDVVIDGFNFVADAADAASSSITGYGNNASCISQVGLLRNVTITNCSFDLTDVGYKPTAYGIYLSLGTWGFENLTVTNNTCNGILEYDGYELQDYSGYGLIYAANVNNADISNNTVSGGAAHAIQLSVQGVESSNFEGEQKIAINGNQIDSFYGYAVYIADTRSPLLEFEICNNVLSNLTLGMCGNGGGAIMIYPNGKPIGGAVITGNIIDGAQIGINMHYAVVSEKSDGVIDVSGNMISAREMNPDNTGTVTGIARLDDADLATKNVITDQPLANADLSTATIYVNSTWESLSDGTKVVANGKIVQVGTNAFADIGDAFEAVGDNGTVMLFNSANLDIAKWGYVDGKDIYLKGSGVIAADDKNTAAWIRVGKNAAGSLTIESGSDIEIKNQIASGVNVSGISAGSASGGVLNIDENAKLTINKLVLKGKAEIDGTLDALRVDMANEENYKTPATLNVNKDGKLIVSRDNINEVGQIAPIKIGENTMLNVNDGYVEADAVDNKGTLTINGGKVDVDTLTNAGTVKVSGESTLLIGTFNNNDFCQDKSIQLLNGAFIKDSTVGGYVDAVGTVTFRGDNTFGTIQDFEYNYLLNNAAVNKTVMIVEEGASVTTNAKKFNLGFGDKLIVNGSIKDAKAEADTLTEEDYSLDAQEGMIIQGLRANDVTTFNINNAYVNLGASDKAFRNAKKDSEANYRQGTYKFNWNNAVVKASTFDFYESGEYNGNYNFLLNDTVLSIGGTFLFNDKDSTFKATDSKVIAAFEATSDSAKANGTVYNQTNAGNFELVNSSFELGSTFVNSGVASFKGSGSKVIAPVIVNTGKLELTGGATVTVDTLTSAQASFTFGNNSSKQLSEITIQTLDAKGNIVASQVAWLNGNVVDVAWITCPEGGSYKVFKGDKDITNEVVSSITISEATDAEIVMDTASTITAGSISGACTITVNAKGFSGVKKVVDLTSGDKAVEVEIIGNSKAYQVTNGNDTYITTADKSSIVLADLGTIEFGTALGNGGKYFAGVNAFSNFNDAFSGAENPVEAMNATKTIYVYGTSTGSWSSIENFGTLNFQKFNTGKADQPQAIVNIKPASSSTVGGVFTGDLTIGAGVTLNANYGFEGNGYGNFLKFMPSGSKSTVTVDGTLTYSGGDFGVRDSAAVTEDNPLGLVSGKEVAVVVNKTGKMFANGDSNNTFYANSSLTVTGTGTAEKKMEEVQFQSGSYTSFLGDVKFENTNVTLYGASSYIIDPAYNLPKETFAGDKAFTAVNSVINVVGGSGAPDENRNAIGFNKTTTLKNTDINAGDMFINGKTFTMEGGKLDLKAGTAGAYGADYTSKGNLTIAKDATLTMTNAALNAEGTVTNSGTLTVTNGTFIADAMNNSGEFNVSGKSTIDIDQINGSVTLNDFTGSFDAKVSRSIEALGTNVITNDINTKGLNFGQKLRGDEDDDFVVGKATKVAIGDKNNNVTVNAETFYNRGTAATTVASGSTMNLGYMVNNGKLDIAGTVNVISDASQGDNAIGNVKVLSTGYDNSKAVINVTGVLNISTTDGQNSNSFIIYDKATLNINGGTFNADDKTAVTNNGIITISGNSTVNAAISGNAVTVANGATLADSNIAGEIQVQGNLNFSGDNAVKTLSAVNGGRLVIEDEKVLTLTGFSFGSKATAGKQYTISGGKIVAKYGFFQHGKYTLESDFETGYMYYSYGSDITVKGNFYSKGAGDGLDYVRGKLTIAAGGSSTHEKSLWVGQPENWGAMNASLTVIGSVTAKTLNVYAGSSMTVNGGTVTADKLNNTGVITIKGNSIINATITGNVAQVAKGAVITLNDSAFTAGVASYTMKLDVYNLANLKSVNGKNVDGNATAGYSVKIGEVLYSIADANAGGLVFTKVDSITAGGSDSGYAGSLDGMTEDYVVEAKGGTANLSLSKGQEITISAITKDEEEGGVTNLNLASGADLNVTGAITDIGKLSTGTGVTLEAATITGTSLNTTINIGKDSTVNVGSIDLDYGNNSIAIGSEAGVTAGNIANVKKLSLASGRKGTDDDKTTLTVEEDIAAPGMANTISLGNYSKLNVKGNIVNIDYNVGTTIKAGNYSEVVLGEIDGNGNVSGGAVASLAGLSIGTGSTFKAAVVGGTSANNTISFGNNAEAKVKGDINLRAGNDTIKTGTGALVEVSGDIKSVETISLGAKGSFTSGDITGVSKLTAGNGTYTKKTDETDWTEVTAGNVTGTEKNDTVSFGNYNDVELVSLDLGAGNDTVKIGSNSIVNLGTVNFGDGKDTLTIGKNSKVKLSTVAELETINATKGASIFVNNGVNVDAVLDSVAGSWKNATIYDDNALTNGDNGLVGSGMVYGNEWDVYELGSGLNRIEIGSETNSNAIYAVYEKGVWDQAVGTITDINSQSVTLDEGKDYVLTVSVASNDVKEKKEYSFGITLA